MARPAAESLNRTYRPIAGSVLFRLAVVLTVIGAGLWVYALATAEPAPAAPAAGSAVVATNSLAATDKARAEAQPEGHRTRFIDRSSPALFRFGVSFIAAFLVGFMARKFLKVTLFVGGILALVIVAMKVAGTSPFDPSALDASVHKGVDWAKQEAGAFQAFVLGYVPSYIAAALGALIGFKRG